MRRALLLAALALAPAALAQQGDSTGSSDYRDGYRRGYDDGYARGYRKGLEEAGRPPVTAPPPPPPGPNGPIFVTRAFYGSTSRSCDATRWVARQSNGRRSASFEVSNAMCGDPARGDRKQLEVTYRCGDFVKTASAYEHRTIVLDCHS